MRKSILFFWGAAVLLLLHIQFVHSQTTEFTYQGSLNTTGGPANGNHDFEFLLYDTVAAGNQIGATVALNNVAVTNGMFTVKLNFGNQFISGANRFLEIRVRPSGQGGMTILSPRQMIGSAPYAIKSLGAFNAESATIASNSLQLGGVAANQYVLTNDPRMTDARPPTAGSVSYIQNTSLQQTASNFNISGNGTVGGMLSSAVVNAVTQYNLSGQRILGTSGPNTVFVGIGAGSSNPTGGNNSFFGSQAGALNTTGNNNAFFGTFAGDSNISGVNNSFFGSNVGHSNTFGHGNSFFGSLAGALNSEGSNNSFFGASSGSANTASDNSFFGYLAGNANTTGFANSFFGKEAGRANTTGSSNSIFGTNAGDSNTTGNGNSFFGATSGNSNTTGFGNSFFGSSSGFANSTGSANAFFGGSSGQSNTVGSANSFFGASSGFANTTGGNNSFFGNVSGVNNTVGSRNSFFGTGAGAANTTANDNSFFGYLSGNANTTGQSNSFFGGRTGQANTVGEFNSFFGNIAGTLNTSGSSNAFFGYIAGNINSIGSFNSFFGRAAGSSNTDGSNNAFFGFQAGNANTTGNNNTMIGANADVTNPNLSFATAIGAGATVSTSNSINIGRSGGLDLVRIPGTLALLELSTGGGTSICRNAFLLIATCSSSARYKSNIVPFRSGLGIIGRLRPVSFNWNDGGIRDLGLVAEDVAEVEPLLTTTNGKGEVEGVKYDRVGVVLVNAVKEQQAQIEQLQRENSALRKELDSQRHTHEEELKALKGLLCELMPEASVCKALN